MGSAQGLSYDCNGNLTYDGTFTYGYDAENRLLTASKSGVAASYQYDPLGRRTRKFGTGVTDTYFLNDGSDEIAEYDSGRHISAYYVPGPAIDEPIAMVTDTAGAYAHTYFHTNHQGSVIATTADDGTRPEGPFSYDPYGTCYFSSTTTKCGTPITSYRFTGRRLDTETGLYYYRARYYDPAKGRFLQTDPVGYTADLNLYTYVGNDPTNKTDPTGMVCNDEGTLCTSDVTPTTNKTIQNSPSTDEAMKQNAGAVQADKNTKVEPMVFVEKDGSIRLPTDVRRDHTDTQDSARAKPKDSDVAVLHGHIPAGKEKSGVPTGDKGLQDDTDHGRSLGDAQPLTAGLTNGTVLGNRIAVHELVNGRAQTRMISGRMTEGEMKDFQENLNSEQILINKIMQQ